ncbi:MAG: M20/M25/M40 family metallo-hydrolase [Halioglobus sp.]|nr:M20/M25/M40 family metallo-hydrolase [Halioglobus sp.]
MALWLLATPALAVELIIPTEMEATAQRLMGLAQRENRAYALVKSLTTEVGPRLAGTEAEDRARQWAVGRLEELGFDNIRVEPFAVPLWLRGEERAEIVAPFPQPLEITALGGSTSTGPQGIQGEVAAFESLAALRQATRESLRGKIVFVNESMARSQDGSGYGRAVLKRLVTASLAEERGAVAALIRSVGTSSHRFAHTGNMSLGARAVGSKVPAAALSAPDADQLQRALDYGEPVVVKIVMTPRSRPLVTSGNVIGEIIGREAPQEIVLVGAHLDSWDLGTGAVDDGAGVGIVIAAAKVLMDHMPEMPRRTIRVVLFGSEEVGVVGARAYAERHAAQLGNHIIAAESDFGSGDIWRFDTRVAPASLGYVTAITEVLAPLGIAPGNNETRGGPDLRFLREAGVPIAGLLQDGHDYFDLHHTPDDTLDKIAPDALDQNVAAYAALLYLVADSDMVFR